MSVFNAVQYFQFAKNHMFHTQRIMKVKPTVDTSKPKAKLQCTKQPLSQFNRIMQMQLQNKSLEKKLRNLETSVPKNDKKFKIIKNNRKQYYQEHSIRTQNQGLLNRIRSAKTSYSRQKLNSQRKDNEKYLNFLCKYGYKGRTNTHFKYNSKTLQKQIKDANSSLKKSTLRTSIKQMQKKIYTQMKIDLNKQEKQQKKQKKIQNMLCENKLNEITNTNREAELKKIPLKKKINLKQKEKLKLKQKQNCIFDDCSIKKDQQENKR